MLIPCECGCGEQMEPFDKQDRPRRFKKNHDKRGKHLSEETRMRMRENHHQLKGESHQFYGKHHSEETRKKISLSSRGKNIGKNNHFYGKHHSEETRERISQSRLGKYIGENNHNHSKNLSYERRKNMMERRLLQIFPTSDTSIEIKLQNILKHNDIRFEKHKPIFGQPDIFVEPNICIFADGDYWHNRPNQKERDLLVNQTLIEAGYKVFRFWEHEINNNIEMCFSIITQHIGIEI